MSKLFSRSRSAATMPKTSGGGPNAGAYSDTDDFGRVRSMAFKRAKTFDSQLERSRQRTLSNPNLLASASAGHGIGDHYRPDTPKDLPLLPDGIFLSTSLTAPGQPQDDFHDHHGSESQQEYGYLHWQNHVILGLDEVVRLVDVVAEELGQRGLTTPLLFSPLAIDIRPNVIRKLISSFVATCPHHLALSSTEAQWREEARFAGPHELAMLLRWGLARIVRLEQGVEVRGFVTWESYVLWRQQEQAGGYSPNHLASFTRELESPVRILFNSLFHLLIRFAANSNSSGLTPAQLASFFGPLVFGIGNSALSFSHIYSAYLRASHAMEHLLLAFIRWQEAQTQLKGAMPVRLKDWVRGYPATIPDMARMEKPRRGARMTRVACIRRNVRLYSSDLIKNAASWSVPKGQFPNSKDWHRIAPPHLKLTPRFSDNFRKYLNVPATFHPDMGPGANVTGGLPTMDSERNELGLFNDLDGAHEDDKFRSLTDMRWGTFENFGFSDTDKNKLAFDLTESARKARSEKRETLTWKDFSSSGFTRSDAPLSASLQFSTPVSSSINSWPSQSAELHRKLKKAQKALPPFGWDTTPVLGHEEVVEEGFMEAFASLLYGGGWMDRSENTFRDCNWALVEFKALPTQAQGSQPSGDPRTSSVLLLFEEFVPQEYRDQLATPKRKGLFAPTALFVASLNPKSKQWKPASTLNGKPYVVGNIPKSPSTREVDFENMLKSNHGTTKVSLSRGISTRDHPVPTPLTSHIPLPDQEVPPVPPLPANSPIKPKSRFKIGRKRSGGMQPAEYDEMDFETREASESDSLEGSPQGNFNDVGNNSKRLSRDDAWIDILVTDMGRRRLPGQDAEPNTSRKRGISTNRSDPELAREEVERALAGAGVPPPDDDYLFQRQQTQPIPSNHGNGHQARIEEPLQDPEPYPYSNPILGRRSIESDEYTQGEGPLIRVQSPSTIASRGENRWPGHHARESMDSQDFEPVPQTLSQEVEIPSFIDSERTYSKEMIAPQPQSATLPPSPSAPASTLPETTPLGTKKANVSTLVDMFQQKTVPQPSRLPVRTASLEGPKAAAAAAAPASNSQTPAPASTSSPAPAPQEEPESITAAPLDLPAGRISPGRYVHGAPLHNVVEEEEEED